MMNPISRKSHIEIVKVVHKKRIHRVITLPLLFFAYFHLISFLSGPQNFHFQSFFFFTSLSRKHSNAKKAKNVEERKLRFDPTECKIYAEISIQKPKAIKFYCFNPGRVKETSKSAKWMSETICFSSYFLRSPVRLHALLIRPSLHQPGPAWHIRLYNCWFFVHILQKKDEEKSLLAWFMQRTF